MEHNLTKMIAITILRRWGGGGVGRKVSLEGDVHEKS